MRLDLLRELGVLVRDGEILSVENFVTEHAAELAPLLGTTATDLLQGPGRPEFVARIGRRLEAVREVARRRRRELAHERATAAATALGQTARSLGQGVWVLDVDVVLGDLISGGPFVRFEMPSANIVIGTDLLRRARILPRMFMDVACFVDPEGLHFRWKAGRGALNLHPQIVDAGSALTISLTERLDMPHAVGDALVT